ncbi:MAG: hypothetical protein Q9219_006239 [cf. Caloplaca sp. 3 TL-2023]
MKTRSRARQVRQSFEDPQDSQVVEAPRTPEILKTPEPQKVRRQRSSLRLLLQPRRSFWDSFGERTQESQTSSPSSHEDSNLTAMMNSLNQKLSHQFDSYKYENHGYLSSSSPSGYDPREVAPINDEEVENLRTAIWPTLQYVAELTKSSPRLPNPKDCYLSQIRHVRQELSDTWQTKGFPGNPPSPFQLEAWTGGITDWRSSHYTDGEKRFPASFIETQIEAWRAEVPMTPVNDAIVADSTSEDHEMEMDSESEIYYPTHGFDNSRTSPTPGDRSHRHALSALYDSHRDIGFLPTTSQIQAYQSGSIATTTLPSLSMIDTGISSSPPIPPLPPVVHRNRSRLPIIFEDQATPQPSSDDADFVGSMSQSSDKENNREEAVRVEREEGGERDMTPSSSQNVINPVGERWVRAERMGMEWEIEREWEGTGEDGCA